LVKLTKICGNFSPQKGMTNSGYPPLVMTPGGLLGKSSVKKHVQKAMPKSITRGYTFSMPKSIPGFHVRSLFGFAKNTFIKEVKG